MKRLLLDNDPMKAAVAGYVDAIAVPQYRATAVASRRRDVRPAHRVLRQIRYAIPAAVAIAVLVAFAPAVVAQVQRILQAFEMVNGRPTQIRVSEVSLDQLRADMPFAVIPPANVPANLSEQIEEIGAGSSGALAVFYFSASSALPVLTIMESSASDRAAENLTMRYGAAGNKPALAPPAGQGRNGFFRYTVTPITWMARGTRITLIAGPGAFNRKQINAILWGMRS